MNDFYSVGTPTDRRHHMCSYSSQTEAHSFKKHLTNLIHSSVCFLMSCKIFHLDKLLFLYAPVRE